MKRYLTLIVLLAIVEIALSLYLTFWREAFWDAIQTKNLKHFIDQLTIFTGVATFICINTSVAAYITALAAIKWRERLNDRVKSSKSIKITGLTVENLPQRIQEDCREYPSLVLNVGFGFIKALVYVIVFSITLILDFNHLYLYIILIYTLISTGVAKKIAAPLIALNYKFQQVEATYRQYLNAENFKNCITTMRALAKKTKHLQYFQVLYSQFNVIIPLIMVAPAYFFGKMTLGGLMQVERLIATIIENLSYGISSFDNINKLLSCRKRLKEIKLI